LTKKNYTNSNYSNYSNYTNSNSNYTNNNSDNITLEYLIHGCSINEFCNIIKTGEIKAYLGSSKLSIRKINGKISTLE